MSGNGKAAGVRLRFPRRQRDCSWWTTNRWRQLDFGYCTEFFIINIKKRTTVTDIDKLRDYLNEIGNSVICIGDLSMVKVHVHTNNTRQSPSPRR